ncbi:MAG: hypothetical protein K2M11_06590 [Paramuribaculum sp.]|nr:hypothetical protein [Paramuribaculum sp.]
MARPKKEKSLLEKALAKEEIDYSKYSMHEIKTVIEELVKMQSARVHKAEIIKLQNVVITASEKIKEILERD